MFNVGSKSNSFGHLSDATFSAWKNASITDLMEEDWDILDDSLHETIYQKTLDAKNKQERVYHCITLSFLHPLRAPIMNLRILPLVTSGRVHHTNSNKARYEGLQMSVIGRFGSRWRNALFDIIKLILLIRFVPPELQRMAQFPIPKNGKRNEYRPISLWCSDICCYINVVTNSYTSLGFEKTNSIMGCLHIGKAKDAPPWLQWSLASTKTAMNISCLSYNLTRTWRSSAIVSPLIEVLLAAMRINGFPNQGFMEMKACAMQSKKKEIVTPKEVAYATFICGLEQGNPDSPTISNLVIKLKHDIWSFLTNKAKHIFPWDLLQQKTRPTILLVHMYFIPKTGVENPYVIHSDTRTRK